MTSVRERQSVEDGSMDVCVSSELLGLYLLNTHQIKLILKEDGQDFALTKSIINLLYNLISVQSIEASQSQRQVIEDKEDLVWQLLDPRIGIKSKKSLLLKNIPLVQVILESCRR